MLDETSPHPMASLEKQFNNWPFLESPKNHAQGVVSIASPVKTALAPAKKHIACSESLSFCLPAASRMIVVGIAIRAVAIVRTIVW